MKCELYCNLKVEVIKVNFNPKPLSKEELLASLVGD